MKKTLDDQQSRHARRLAYYVGTVRGVQLVQRAIGEAAGSGKAWREIRQAWRQTSKGASEMNQPTLDFTTKPSRSFIFVRHADLEQPAELERVKTKLVPIVLAFFAERRAGDEFHINDLILFAWSFDRYITATSPDRIMRELKKDGQLSYELINRAKSLYRVTELGAE